MNDAYQRIDPLDRQLASGLKARLLPRDTMQVPKELGRHWVLEASLHTGSRMAGASRRKQRWA